MRFGTRGRYHFRKPTAGRIKRQSGGDRRATRTRSSTSRMVFRKLPRGTLRTLQIACQRASRMGNGLGPPPFLKQMGRDQDQPPFLNLNRQGVTVGRVNEFKTLAIVLGSQCCYRRPTNPFIAESTTFVSYWGGLGGHFLQRVLIRLGLAVEGRALRVNTPGASEVTFISDLVGTWPNISHVARIGKTRLGKGHVPTTRSPYRSIQHSAMFIAVNVSTTG